MAVVSFTGFPLEVPPKKKLKRLPFKESFGLSRERNRYLSGFMSVLHAV
jgi:hypothetical protein